MMKRMVFIKFCATISLLLCLIASVTEAVTFSPSSESPSYVCPNTTTFSPNSSYETNLHQLLSWLSSNSTRPNGFYNTTIGGRDPFDETIYGLFLCRGDITADSCRDCVSTAASYLPQVCPTNKNSEVWYEACILKYANTSFFSTLELQPTISVFIKGTVSDQNRFMDLLGDTMRSTAGRASVGGSDKKYATGEVKFTSLQNLYTLAQCRPDLSVSDCYQCLESVISNLPNGSLGARTFNPSCIVWYELHQFYNQEAAPPPEKLDPNTTVPAPEQSNQTDPKGKTQISVAIVVAIVASIVLGLLLSFLACSFKTRRASKKYNSEPEEIVEISGVEYLQFDLETIKLATNNFCDDNKLGEGGFGEVFKGTLPNGQDIAVKRLSLDSRQGDEQFKNEVVLVAKLQHRNLVRVLGFCLDGEEKILIYEFAPNKSLDYFLFDIERQYKLNWPKRFKIIQGVARGMLYLHEDSRLRIIHRDLKASNILLDEDLNPKIADFGMARIFGVDQTQGITDRVMGTFGYMPPEYVMRGHFSIKLDVYSFGVLILEIISGKKNTSFHESGYAEDLLNNAWKKWRDGTPLEFLDMSVRDSCNRDEVSRCIHIGLSCVQDDPTQRPTMQTIVMMLNSDSISLVTPQRPRFLVDSRTTEPKFPLESNKSFNSKSALHSVDKASITKLHPR